MTPSDPYLSLRRAIAFGRHMPVAKLARRVELEVRRRVRDGIGTVRFTAMPDVHLQSAPPMPIFALRTGMCLEGGSRFRFLNRGVEMPDGVIDWTRPSLGPRDQLWRMNLHYMEYLEEVDDATFAALVEQWLAVNVPTQAGAWRDSWNSYALSLRVVVWMQQLARRRDQVSIETAARIDASLIEQLDFLERNLETDLGGNHLIKNLKALVWGAAFFVGPTAERWRTLGLKYLARELPRQILPDGMHNERSPSYHCQVFADLLEVRHALGHDPLSGRLDDALARMAQVTADLTHPDGGVALFNDAGLAMAYAPAACLDAYARLYGTKPTPRSVFALRDAGYYGMRSGDTYFVADCGRIAPDDLPAHGHGDVLSFEWSVAGQRIIVDQGVYEYNAGQRRQRSRSAASHNTLCFEAADQADFFGAFRCGRRPNVEVLAFEQTANGMALEGTHDGFRTLQGAPQHVRRFEVQPRRVTLRDVIEGKAARAARISFLLAPEVACVAETTGVVLRTAHATMQMTASAELRIEDAVWWPDMGRELRTKRICLILPPGTREVTTTLEILQGSA